MTTKTLHGPNGAKIVLDLNEVYPEDPGNGTPAMFYYGGGSATYWCALGEGEVDAGRKGMIEIPGAVYRWMEAQEDAVNTFLYHPEV